MEKRIKRGLATIMAAVMCLILTPITVLVASDVITTDSGVFTIQNGVLTAFNGQWATSAHLVIPNGVVRINDGVRIPNWGSLFTELTLPNGLEATGNGSFSDMRNLRQVNMPSSLRSIGANAFADSASLHHIDIPHGVTEIGALAFAQIRSWGDDMGLVSINLPDTVTSIGTSAFHGSRITHITIPRDMTEITGRAALAHIAYGGAFSNMRFLESVTMHSGITHIGNRAFMNAERLSHIDIPSSVVHIGEGAFMGTNIREITIPPSVIYIGQNAFHNHNLGWDDRILIRGAIGSFAQTYAQQWGFDFWDMNQPMPEFFVPERFGFADTLVSYHGAGGNIVVPNNVTTIRPSVFASTNVTSITFPDFVQIIGNPFAEGVRVTVIGHSSLRHWAEHNGHTFVERQTGASGSGGVTPPDMSLPGSTQQIVTPITPPTQTAPNLAAASIWAHDGINNAFNAGLIPFALQSSYTQVTTRAEFAALAVYLYEAATRQEIMGRVEFNDTDDINVQKMGYLAVVTGVGYGNFAPDSTLTREQAAVMIARLAYAIGQPLPQAAPTFYDNGHISDWAIEAVGQVQATQIMGGVGNNYFAPRGDYTREQSIITMLRLFDILYRF